MDTWPSFTRPASAHNKGRVALIWKEVRANVTNQKQTPPPSLLARSPIYDRHTPSPCFLAFSPSLNTPLRALPVSMNLTARFRPGMGPFDPPRAKRCRLPTRRRVRIPNGKDPTETTPLQCARCILDAVQSPRPRRTRGLHQSAAQ